jgi:flagellar protein FliO/FliZ
MLEPNLLKAFLTLMACAAVMGGILIVLKRYAKKKTMVTGGVELHVIARQALQPKAGVFIVKAGDKTLVLGVTEHNVTTLADITEPVLLKSTQPKETLLKEKGVTFPESLLKARPEISQAAFEQPPSFGEFLKTVLKGEKSLS